MIKAVIIDDEVHCIKTLTMLLREYCVDVKIMEQRRCPRLSAKTH